jgi:hypothetical protein
MPKQKLSDEQILTVVKQMEAGRTARSLWSSHTTATGGWESCWNGKERK